VTRADTPARLLAAIVWGSGLLSALITNDAVCVLGAPLIVSLIRRHRLPPLPYLLALATAANTGSVATLVGNPQNMLCGILGQLSYRDHLLLAAPIALVGLAINHALLHVAFRKQLQEATLSPADALQTFPRSSLLSLGVIAFTAVVYTLGADLAWTSIAGFVVLLLLRRHNVQPVAQRIDWSLLLFFAALFVVVEGLMHSGVPQQLFARYPLLEAQQPDVANAPSLVSWLRLSSIFLIGSNLVSNVPFILVVRDQMASLPNPTLAWELLAIASTFAGNLTLLGSVANVIVAESSRSVGSFSFRQHLAVGLPLSLLTTLFGALWIHWLAG
jgi:Na+/H+ antiporter NhaD/arsenite permease-like protein